MTITEQNEAMIQRVDELNARLKDEPFEIEISKKFKNNGTQISYILRPKVNEKRSNVVPSVTFSHLKHVWESTDAVVSFLIDAFHTDIDSLGFHPEYITNRDHILEHVTPRLVSETNEAEVEASDIVYQKYLDMLILYTVDLNMPSDEETARFTLTNKLISCHDLDIKEIHEHAIHNIEQNYRIQSLSEMLTQLMDDPEDYEMDDDGPDQGLWVVTNQTGVDGASVILSEQVLAELRQKLGEEFILLPSSVNEFLAMSSAHDGKNNPDELRELVTTVNDSYVLPEDRLTYNVYLYTDGSLKSI